MSRELIRVDHCPSQAKLILVYKIPNGEQREHKAVVNKEDALEVAKAIGWTGPVGEIGSLSEVAAIKAEADAA